MVVDAIPTIPSFCVTLSMRCDVLGYTVVTGIRCEIAPTFLTCSDPLEIYKHITYVLNLCIPYAYIACKVAQTITAFHSGVRYHVDALSHD